MGNVFPATTRQEKMFRERAEEIIVARHEKIHGEISGDQIDQFIEANESVIEELQNDLMSEAGLE